MPLYRVELVLHLEGPNGAAVIQDVARVAVLDPDGLEYMPDCIERRVSLDAEAELDAWEEDAPAELPAGVVKMFDD